MQRVNTEEGNEDMDWRRSACRASGIAARKMTLESLAGRSSSSARRCSSCAQCGDSNSLSRGADWLS